MGKRVVSSDFLNFPTVLVWRDNLGERAATIRMRIRGRGELMIVAATIGGKRILPFDCRGASISRGF
jgi:hypothetical protein